MSLTSGPINETEQAAEKAADHIGAASLPLLVKLLDELFQRIWRTRITVTLEVEERK